eukprot:360772-Chlamydomonas_euryale.AAC.2
MTPHFLFACVSHRMTTRTRSALRACLLLAALTAAAAQSECPDGRGFFDEGLYIVCVGAEEPGRECQGGELVCFTEDSCRERADCPVGPAPPPSACPEGFRWTSAGVQHVCRGMATNIADPERLVYECDGVLTCFSNSTCERAVPCDWTGCPSGPGGATWTVGGIYHVCAGDSSFGPNGYECVLDADLSCYSDDLCVNRTACSTPPAPPPRCPLGGSFWTRDNVAYHCVGTILYGDIITCDGTLTCFTNTTCAVQRSCPLVQPPQGPGCPIGETWLRDGLFYVCAGEAVSMGTEGLECVNPDELSCFTDETCAKPCSDDAPSEPTDPESGCPSGGTTWTEDGITYHCAGASEFGGEGIECEGALTCYLDEGCMIQIDPCPPVDNFADSFGAYLKGKFQVPAVRSPAWGYSHLSLVNDTYAVVDITVHDITNTFAAHVHNGTAGTNG